jgi:hypothetical protein
LEGRRQAEDAETQASIGSHITVVQRSQIYSLSSSEASDDESIDTKPPEPVTIDRSQSEPFESSIQPPASTAPPRFQQPQEGRSTRKRAGTGFYNALLTGDSQEIKRARQ